MKRGGIMVGTSFLVALSLPAAAETPGPREAIEAANSEFSAAYRRGDVRAVAAFYTERGQLFPPHAKLVSGRPAIEEFWKAAMDSGAKSVELKTREVDAFGDSAVESGTYTLSGKNGEPLDRGKYLVLWKRLASGWRLHRDCWNSDESPPK
jgi:uncharacterized protein (TIGR02246 family)